MQENTRLGVGIKKLLSQRSIWAGCAIVAFLSMVFALYMEHVEGLTPCNLCMLQRAPMIGIGILTLIAFIHHPKAYGQVGYGLSNFVISILGCIVAGRHIWLQNLPPDQVPACGPDYNFLMDQFPLLETLIIIMEGSGDCAEIKWSFLGLSMPSYVFILFLGYCLVSLIQAYRGMKYK